MYEYHGWATIRDSAGCEGEADDPSQAKLAAVRTQLEATPGDPTFQVADLRSANGDWHVRVSGMRNHRQAQIPELWRQLAALAPGSYGPLHVHDDEEPEWSNTWAVWVMVRGTVRREVEGRLSPHVVVVEDDCSDLP